MMNQTQNVIVESLVKCTNFAAIRHKDQRCKNAQKEPFINHPIGVAYILTNEAKITDIPTIQAAILHNTVEDTGATFEDIEDEFGKEVRDLVFEVTGDINLDEATRKQLQIEKAPFSSPKAKLVKLADKLYNLRELEKLSRKEWSEEKTQGHYEYAKKVVDGLRGTNAALEKCLDEIFEKHIVNKL